MYFLIDTEIIKFSLLFIILNYLLDKILSKLDISSNMNSIKLTEIVKKKSFKLFYVSKVVEGLNTYIGKINFSYLKRYMKLFLCIK